MTKIEIMRKNNRLLELLRKRDGVLILDGGLATALESEEKEDLDDPLWYVKTR